MANEKKQTLDEEAIKAKLAELTEKEKELSEKEEKLENLEKNLETVSKKLEENQKKFEKAKKAAKALGNPEKENVDYKKFLKEQADKKAKLKYRDRLKIEIIKDTRYYKVGQIHEPNKLFAKHLISEGIAKAVKKQDD